MVKEKEESYDFLGNLVVSLMSKDKLFTNKFFQGEFSVSDRLLSEMKRGKEEYIYQYVRLIQCMLKNLNLKILLDEILKQIKVALASHYDLVIATVPHCSHGAVRPEKWEVIMQWDGVIL